MSRTDKDAPYWVRSEWYEPYHMCAEHHSRAWQQFIYRCDLPPEPVMQRSELWRRRVTSCHWVPAWESRSWTRPGPPKWFRDHVWTNHIRAQVRDELRRAATEHRATRDVTTVPNIDHHRNNAKWLWW